MDVPYGETNASPRSDQIMTRVSEGRFDENLTLIVKEIMDEVLTNLDWWAGQVWWFLPGGFEQAAWQTSENAPGSFNNLSVISSLPTNVKHPTEFYLEPTILNLSDAHWLPNRDWLKDAGVRNLVMLDIVAEDRPSARLVFIVPSSKSLTAVAKQFLSAASVLLPKMVIRERARTELQFRATHDALTGLLNRRGLTNLLELATSPRNMLRSVMFIDLDKFKEINDAHGHPIGDELLVHIASQLGNTIRPTDALARIGGDEFVVVAGEVSSAADAEAFAKRLWKAIATQHTFSNGAKWNGTGSVGVAIWEPAENYLDVLRTADMLMYKAKKSGLGVQVQDLHALNQESDSLIEPIQVKQLVRLSDQTTCGYQVTVETVLRSPDSAQLGQLIADRLDLLANGAREEIWLRLPKSFWLDADRISGLLDQLRHHTGGANLSLVLACDLASYEARMVAREIFEQYAVTFVLDSFGTGTRDFDLLRLLEPIALVIDANSMQPNELSEDKASNFDWAGPKSVISIANVHKILSVAPSGATDNQLSSLASIGCDLGFINK